MKKSYISKLLAMLTVVCVLLSVLAAVPVSADTTTPDGTTVLYKELPVGTQTRGNETRLVMKITDSEEAVNAYSEVGFYVTIDGATERIAVDSLYDSFYNNGNLVMAADLDCTYVAILELGALAPYTKVQAQGYFVESIAQTAGDPAVIKGNVNIKLPNVATYTYRVGNQNNISLGNLFNAAPYAKVKPAKVEISTETVSGTATAAYTANATDWTAGTVKFDGTGTVKMTVDYAADKPVELNLEVVNATNVTTATDATDKDVVLLKNCSLGDNMITVSGGHTFYGNGFKLSCSGRGVRLAADGYAEGFVNVIGGTLDNLQVVCRVFPKGYLYKNSGSEYIRESSNLSSASDATHNRYDYQWSGISVREESTISNCHVYGARNNVYIGSGNITLDNCVLESGALANIQIISNDGSTVTFKDLTTVQYLTDDGFSKGMKIMGAGILMGSGDKEIVASETNPIINIEGAFNQYNWVSSDDQKNISGSTEKSIASSALGQSQYQHDGYVNTGIVCLNNNPLTVNGLPEGYTHSTVSMLSLTGQTYSLATGYGTVDTSYNNERKYPYQSTIQGKILPEVLCSVAGTTVTKGYKSYGLTVTSPLDFTFADITVDHQGTSVPFTVKDADGEAVASTTVFTLNDISTRLFTLSFTVTEANGETTDYDYQFALYSKVEKINPPTYTASYEAGLCVASTYGGTWSGAAPALEGITVTYYSSVQKQYVDLALNTLTPTTKGKQNGTNTTWTYTDPDGDFTLTLTGGQVHSSNKINAMPVVCDGKLYFVASAVAGLVNSGNSARSVPVSYSFSANGDTLSFSHSWSVAENKNEEYKYSDFCNGTLTKLTKSSGGGGCVTGDTLVAMADGTEKAIADVKAGENVIAFDHERGEYVSVPALAVFNHGYGLYDTVKLNFSDETELNLVIGHSFFDLDLNKYVEIYPENCQDFIGHRFVRYEGDNTICSATLISATVSTEYTECWGMFSYSTLSVITNGLLSAPNCEGIYNYFEYDENLKYNERKMLKDIEEYGTYTYEDWAEYISEYVYDGFNFKYFKVAVEKGIVPIETYFGYIDLLNYLYSIN